MINLAGAPIADGRWNEARKQLLVESRVLTTRLLVEALSRCSSKPRTLINASGIGYYGASDDRVLDEGAARGQGFLADLCLAWEAEALRAAELGVRVVMLRTGMVLEQDGGALPKMLLPFKIFRRRSDHAGNPVGVVDPSARSHRIDPVAAHNAERLWSRQRSGSRGCDDEPVLQRARTSAPSAVLASCAGFRIRHGIG